MGLLENSSLQTWTTLRSSQSCRVQRRLPQGSARCPEAAGGARITAHIAGAIPVSFAIWSSCAREALPLQFREEDMSFGTAKVRTVNFLLSSTWPMLRTAFRDQGDFAWYASWCLIGWVHVRLFLPGAKTSTIEILDPSLCRRGSINLMQSFEV